MNRRRGFSLLEVMFALTVMAFFFFTLMSLYPTTMAAQRQSEHRLLANSFAQEILDTLSAGPFALMQTPGSYTAAAPGTLPASCVTPRTLPDGYTLRPTVLIEPGPTPQTTNNLRQITVTIEWTEYSKSLRVVRHRRIAKVQR